MVRQALQTWFTYILHRQVYQSFLQNVSPYYIYNMDKTGTNYQTLPKLRRYLS